MLEKRHQFLQLFLLPQSSRAVPVCGLCVVAALGQSSSECVCVCVREREREREEVGWPGRENYCPFVLTLPPEM